MGESFGCGTHNPVKVKATSLYQKKVSSISSAHTGETRSQSLETLYVEVQYVVLYLENTTPKPLAALREQHRILNEAFGYEKGNPDPTDKNEASFYFQKVTQAPGIQFNPTNHLSVNPEYYQITQELSVKNPLNDVLRDYGRFIKPERLTIFILTNPYSNLYQLLGEAGSIGSNYCFVRSTTFAELGPLGKGKTLVHEVAHCLGLKHIFSDQKNPNCLNDNDDIQDTPVQLYSNTCQQTNTLEYFNDVTNTTTVKNVCVDNASLRQGCANVKLEMYMNHMDYSPDAYRRYFSKNQCVLMRETLRSPPGHASIPYLVAERVGVSYDVPDPPSTGSPLPIQGEVILPSFSDNVSAEPKAATESTNSVLIVILTVVSVGVVIAAIAGLSKLSLASKTKTKNDDLA
jgi:hypothetical protein